MQTFLRKLKSCSQFLTLHDNMSSMFLGFLKWNANNISLKRFNEEIQINMNFTSDCNIYNNGFYNGITHFKNRLVIQNLNCSKTLA